MNINHELKKIELAEKALHKQIDDQVALEEEIQEVAKYTAKALMQRPMVPMSIQERNFIVVASLKENEIQIAAREKLAILTPNATVIKANLTIDTDYTQEENLLAGVKAILGHITGHIKPEVLD